jgi:peroxiredoxin
MDAALLTARLLLVAVFLAAAVAKLMDREGAREAMRVFGVPAPLAPLFGGLLPVAELCVAAALLFPSTAWSGAVAAAVLLLIFVEGIAMNLVRGNRPPCQCFGRLRAAPMSWWTLLRTLALTGVAGFVVIAGAGDVGPGPADLDAGTAALLAAGLAAAALLAALVGQNLRLRRRLAELERPTEDGAGPAVAVGAEAPGFALGGLHGERLTLESLRAAGRPVLLVFTDPGCGPCSALLPAVARVQRDHAREVTVALVSGGGAEDNRARSREHGVSNVLLQTRREVAEAFGVDEAPAAVLVLADGTVGSPLAVGPEAVRELLGGAVRVPPASLRAVAGGDGPAVGRPAPEIELEDLDGRPFSLLDLEGERALVLFWDPACGYCAGMLSDLAAWAADPPAGAPHLVVVSRGSVDANRALGLDTTVLIDPDWSTTRAYGVAGTPMGVLVDEEGRIASRIAAGAPAIFELLSVETAS